MKHTNLSSAAYWRGLFAAIDGKPIPKVHLNKEHGDVSLRYLAGYKKGKQG
jgi:hypothetical protein